MLDIFKYLFFCGFLSTTCLDVFFAAQLRACVRLDFFLSLKAFIHIINSGVLQLKQF